MRCVRCSRDATYRVRQSRRVRSTVLDLSRLMCADCMRLFLDSEHRDGRIAYAERLRTGREHYLEPVLPVTLR